jgi:nitrous oxidase accessory protein
VLTWDRGRASRAAIIALLALVSFAGVVKAAPARPGDCEDIEPGRSLQQALDDLPSNGSLCLAAGRHEGPLVIRGAQRVWGAPGAWIHSNGKGSTITIEGSRAALLGIGVDGSGGRFDLLDAAVRVTGDDVRVEGVMIRDALFGILVEQARGAVIRTNVISGMPDKPLGMRGDGIRLWEVKDSLVEGNLVEDSRDMVVWYASRNRFVANRVVRGRYGAHFMYSHDNIVEGNEFIDDVVGIFAMYSRGLRVHDNLLARAHGAAGMGLGAKESGNLDLVGNRFVGNTTGIYLDTSPLDPRDHNRFEDNHVRFCGTGIVFHGRAKGNEFHANSFRDNRAQVRIEGRGDALDATWQGNDFDDYVGYDLDGDGFGDLPYELRSLSGELTARTPQLAYFRGMPALAMVEVVGRAVPLLQPRTLVVDPRPRMRPPTRDQRDAN